MERSELKPCKYYSRRDGTCLFSNYRPNWNKPKPSLAQVMEGRISSPRFVCTAGPETSIKNLKEENIQRQQECTEFENS